MHLDGYGCPGASAVAYGLACLELEAGDSGVRSFASVQGSLAMYAIYRWGDEAQKQDVASGNGARRAHRLLRPDRARFRQQSRGDAHARRGATGGDWILDGTKMWITNGSIADLAIVWAQTDERHPRFHRAARYEGLQRLRYPSQALAARVGHQRARPERLPPSRPTRCCRSRTVWARRSPV